MLTRRQQEELVEICGQGISFDVDMAAWSTLRAGGRADGLAEVTGQAQLSALLDWCRRQAIPPQVIGGGSNILVRDEGFAGVIVRLAGDFAAIREEPDEPIIHAGGGCTLARLLNICRDRGLAGLEFLVGIPGSVGGAVRMNAGAHGRETGEFLHALHLIDRWGGLREIPHSDMELSYRSLTLSDVEMEESVIVEASFGLQRDDPADIGRKMLEFSRLRKKVQPISLPSAGSFFRNPPGEYAGRLIEEAGLKGVCVGGAMVSPMHANFIVNPEGKATATDIVELMQLVQGKVMEHSSIFLEPEVHIL